MADPIAIVLPWFGTETAGGAETHARQLVAALHRANVPIEVWSTTARDARAPLDPFYPAGDSTIDGVRIRRFAPNRGAGSVITGRFASDEHPIPELNLLQSLTGSDALLDALSRERATRRWVFFLYAFPTTFWGVQIAGDRGYLIPCLHDEPYAYNTTTRRTLQTARRVLANSHGERTLIQRLANLPDARVPVVGEGIEMQWGGDGDRLRRRFDLDGPLIYFAGRRDHSKNFPLLAAYFEEYLARRGPCATLIVSGPGRLDVPPALRRRIVDLGFVDDQTKHDAYAAADIFCMPSLHESFCIVVMEAWLNRTPALVHGDCLVTVDHCRRSNGGLWFRSYREFEACLDRLLGDRDLSRELGAQGSAWVERECRWEDVADRFVEAIQ